LARGGTILWFAKDPEFDRRFRDRFLTLHEAAARSELDAWTATPEGSLGLIILLERSQQAADVLHPPRPARIRCQAAAVQFRRDLPLRHPFPD
jgi:hypothetical protein